MILGILQARMSSSRLPGKVLKPILNRPMLELQIERLKRSKQIERMVVATSDIPEDKAIIDLCRRIGVHAYAGNLDNVLDRFYQTAKRYRPDHVVRITGDCPLIDPELIDKLISFYFEQACDYVSNCRPPTLPDGLDAEVFSFHALEISWKNAVYAYHLEHVTPYILSHPDRFKISNYTYAKDFSDLRWTVDYPDDFELIKQVYEALYDHNPKFGIEEIIKLLDKRPSLKTMNIHHKRALTFRNIQPKQA